MSKKKKEVHVPGLPEPWKAFHSKKRKRTFYFNMETKETTWEMPVVKDSVTESDLYPVLKQLNAKHQQEISGRLEKKDASCQKNLGPWETDVRRVSNNCIHSLDIPSTSERNEELMEVDEIIIEEINCPEEPMEVDFIVGEVQAFRREHFLHPNPCAEDNASFSDTAKYTGVCETTKNAGMMLIVFDTSCLLQDTALLPMCIQRACCSLIPYTVLQELDGLKKAKSDELRSKVIKTVAYLHDCIKRRCNYLFIENTFEASNNMEEFGCQNNDDIILKCAFVTTKKYEKEPIRVVFATNDKNLAVKAAAHNIITADRNELLHLLTTESPKEKSQQFIIRNESQKVSLPDFSFVIDKPSSSTVGTMEVAAPKKVMDHLFVPLDCQSSSVSFISVPQKEKISSYNSTSSIAVSGKIKDKPRNFIRRKKECHEASSSFEQRRNHHQQRLAPYSIRKVGEEDSRGDNRSSKKRKLCQLSAYSMNDFLEVFAKLVEHLQHRSDRKSVEDTRRISKVIDSVIANESFSLNVLIDMVSKFYDFYADRDVFISATHFDKKKLANEYESTASTVKEKLRTFQKQLRIV